MKTEILQPFIDATTESFEIMTGEKPSTAGEAKYKQGIFGTYDMLASISLIGDLPGEMILASSPETGQKMVELIMGEEIKPVSPDLFDGFGEIINIISGAVTGKFKGMDVRLGLPNVIIGKDQKLNSGANVPWLSIPFVLPNCGDFSIEIAVEDQEQSTSVLVVDDSKMIRLVQKRVLKSMGITNIMEANDGEEAFKMLRQGGSFDLLLFDINLPGMNGIDLLKKIRSMDEIADCPVIMCTSVSNEIQLDEARQAGAIDVIIKPFQPSDLKEKVKAVLPNL